MIINNLDLGAHPTWALPLQTRKGPEWGADTKNIEVVGGQSLIWVSSGTVRKRTETVWITIAPADATKVLRLVRQLQEISNNPNMQPVYIQWASGGGQIVVDPEDGWYTLEKATPDEEVASDGIVPVQIIVSYLAPGLLSKALAVSWLGGPATIGWGGPAINWLAYPINASGMPFQLSRFGGEGYIPISYQLPMSALAPQPFTPSAAIADLLKGRVYVYDTINTGTFPVPTNGPFANTGWNEVFHPDHEFLGDCVITNGLILLIFSASGAAQTFTVYFWNIVTNQWLSIGTITVIDNAGSGCTLRSFALGKISHRESSIRILANSANNIWVELTIRVVSGSYYFRIQAKALGQTNTNSAFLTFFPQVAPKISFNETNVKDNTLSAEQVDIPLGGSTWGYSAAFSNSSAQPYVFGWFYQDNTGQTIQGSAASAALSIGDSHLLPIINQSRFYGFFVFPFLTPNNLTREGESGTFGTGWSQVADAAASAGQTAKEASGTAAFSNLIFGTIPWFPPPGLYNVWFRIRVANNAGGNVEMQIGIINNTSGAWIGTPRNLKPSDVSTSYAWYQGPLAVFIPPAGIQISFQAQNQATLSTDWFIDEAVMTPLALGSPLLYGPRDLFSEFAFDRATKVIPI